MTVTTSTIQRVEGMKQGLESVPSVLVLKQKSPCRHPQESRITDPETGEIVCKCGEVLGRVRQRETPEEYLGRSPVNDAVYKGNMSEKTSKNGQPVSHYIATSAVYGNEKYSMRPLEFLVKTCPACGKQQPVKVFGESIHCENKECGIELGHFVLRWLPYIPQNGNKNGNGNTAMRYMFDLKMLSLWDPPENDQTIRVAKELFSKKVQGHVSAEKAHFLSRRFLRGVKQLNKVYRKDMENLLEGLLQSEGIKVK
jgi:hypothetical protein